MKWKKGFCKDSCWKRMLIGALAVLVVGASCMAQNTNPDRANLLKLDLFGPTSGLFYKHPNTRIRASLEFEHRFNRHISMVVDGEWDHLQYTCYILHVWPDYNSFPDEVMNTTVWQNQLGILAGFRYRLWLGKTRERIYSFVEGRLSAQYRHAYIQPDHIGRPTSTKANYAIAPRARMGIGLLATNRIGLEGSVDLATYKFLATGKRVIRPIVELNLAVEL